MSKAILLDIDGTLLNSKKELTPRTKDALLKAQAQGCRLVLASGRPVNGLAGLAKDLKMDEYGGLLVAFNGGMVLDAKTGEVLFERAMRVEESRIRGAKQPVPVMRNKGSRRVCRFSDPQDPGRGHAFVFARARPRNGQTV